MPKIKKNQVIGNFGCNLVTYILSKFFIVRSVTEGTDIGIDLYCETIEKKQGFMHFWVQVKSGSSQINLLQNGKASCSFDIEHLKYWRRQPVPVFAFYVPCESPFHPPNEIFYSDLTHYLINNGIPNSKTHCIQSIESFEINSEDWTQRFLRRIRYSTSLIKFRDFGAIVELPKLKQDYIINYPVIKGYTSNDKAIKKSLRTIRSTVSVLVLDAVLLHSEGHPLPKESFFAPVIDILKIFKKGKRPEIMLPLALWTAVVEEDLEGANKLLQIGIDSIENDPNLQNDQKETWKNELKHNFQLVLRKIK